MNCSIILRKVALSTAERAGEWFDELNTVPRKWQEGGRCGTLVCTLGEFARQIGDPHKAAPFEQWREYDRFPLVDGAGKISAIWYFDTPRGLVEVSDYWWNRENELSIRATDRRALRWFSRWAKLVGVNNSKSAIRCNSSLHHFLAWNSCYWRIAAV